METKTMRGKDPECLLYDCPHKTALNTAYDEIKELEKTNQGLNARLESIENLISQGLIDFKQLLQEVLKDTDKLEDINKIKSRIEGIFDIRKITDIVNENLGLRKSLHAKEIHVVELMSRLSIVEQEKHALEISVKSREEKDLHLIKEIRSLNATTDKQMKTLKTNENTLQQQELQLRALDDFVSKARSSIDILQRKQDSLLSENKILSEENLFLSSNYKLLLTPRGKKAYAKMKLLSNNSLLSYLFIRNRKKEYEKLKDLYFNLSTAERTYLSVKFDMVAKQMENGTSKNYT